MEEYRRTLTEIVSFSFTMGTTPILKSSLIVFTAFKYRVRCQQRDSVAQRTHHYTRRAHIRNITPRKQNLRRPLIELTKQVVPERDKSALTDSRKCLCATLVRKGKSGPVPRESDATDLFLGETLGPLGDPHRSETDADGARADENNFVT